MKLSVDAINEKSPIWVIQLDDMLFRFVTRNGIKYRVGFYTDKVFLEEGAYHFFIERVDNHHGAYDSDVFKVVSLIIEEFFRDRSNVMLYICDPSDNRQVTRSRLYRIWYDSFEKREEFTLSDKAIEFERVTIYAGLLIKKNNPAYQLILEAFDDFVNLIPCDNSILDK